MPRSKYTEREIQYHLAEAKRGFGEGLTINDIPYHMRDDVLGYLEFGHEPGGFFEAVMANDFTRAVKNADPANSKCLKAWSDYVHNFLPGRSVGSYEAIRQWVVQGGLRGNNNEEEENENAKSDE